MEALVTAQRVRVAQRARVGQRVRVAQRVRVGQRVRVVLHASNGEPWSLSGTML